MSSRTRVLRAVKVGLAVTAVGSVLAACSSGAGSASSSNGPANSNRVLTIAVQFQPKAGYAIDTDDAFILSSAGVLETLVAAGPDGQLKPGLATQWAQTTPLEWDFTLREGVVFQDGTPLDADAVATALTYVAGVASVPRALKGVGLQVRALDPTTVRITTAAADPVLPLRLTSPNVGVLAPAAYRATPPNVIGTGSGPFQITKLQARTSATMQRYDNYWGGRAVLAGAQFRYLPDPASRVSAIQAGDVDIAQGVPATSLSALQGDPGLSVQQILSPRTTTLYTNLEQAALSDVRVREAIERAIDRPQLVSAVLEGVGEPADEVFGSAVSFGRSTTPPKADPAAAKRLLAAAGYDSARPLSLRLWTYSERPELPDLATAIQAMLKNAGIRTEIKVAEYATQEPKVLSGDFDLFILSRSYLTDFPDASGYLASDFVCAGSYNLNRYCSTSFDARVARLAQTVDPGERVALFTEAAAQLSSEHVGVPLLHTGSSTALRTSVQGYVPDPLEHTLLTLTLR